MVFVSLFTAILILLENLCNLLSNCGKINLVTSQKGLNVEGKCGVTILDKGIHGLFAGWILLANLNNNLLIVFTPDVLSELQEELRVAVERKLSLQEIYHPEIFVFHANRESCFILFIKEL